MRKTPASEEPGTTGRSVRDRHAARAASPTDRAASSTKALPEGPRVASPAEPPTAEVSIALGGKAAEDGDGGLARADRRDAADRHAPRHAPLAQPTRQGRQDFALLRLG